MKIAVFVDGANFFYMQKDKLQWRVDPGKILDWLSQKGQIVDAFFYMAIDPQSDNQMSFRHALTHMNYVVNTKELKTINLEGGSVVRKANFDVEISVDMALMVDLYDMAVLVSGDADFCYILQHLRSKGKKFMVLATAGYIAREIRTIAGMHFIDFNDIRSEVERTT